MCPQIKSSILLPQLLPSNDGTYRYLPFCAVARIRGCPWIPHAAGAYRDIRANIDRTSLRTGLDHHGRGRLDHRHTQDTPGSIEEMADDYLAEIRKIQPHGPHHLLGWSFGGLVAHAVAVRLEAVWEEVALLALLDSHPLPKGFRASEIDGSYVLMALLGSSRGAAVPVGCGHRPGRRRTDQGATGVGSGVRQSRPSGGGGRRRDDH